MSIRITECKSVPPCGNWSQAYRQLQLGPSYHPKSTWCPWKEAKECHEDHIDLRWWPWPCGGEFETVLVLFKRKLIGRNQYHAKLSQTRNVSDKNDLLSVYCRHGEDGEQHNCGDCGNWLKMWYVRRALLTVCVPRSSLYEVTRPTYISISSRKNEECYGVFSHFSLCFLSLVVRWSKIRLS